MLPAVVFDDDHALLAPLTDLRASFDVRMGAMTTLHRLERACDLWVLGLVVPEKLRRLAGERHNRPINDVLAVSPDDERLMLTGRRVLVVNGRCAIPPEQITKLAHDQALVESDGSLVAGWVDLGAVTGCVGDAAALVRRTLEAVREHVRSPKRSLLARPWHARSSRDAAIAGDLRLMMDMPARAPGPGVQVIGDPRDVRVHPDARVYPSVVLDAEHGPIVIDDHAVVRPGAVLTGPVYVGSHTHILDRAVIKANTAAGPMCKLAGEVGGTIVQGFSNKGHDGHLGDSWLGEWVNLGAGTTNSNLLNTYGEVIARASPASPTERTGETFLGCVLGDHVKTAICTRIMTGAIAHTGVMWAAADVMGGCVEPFAWVTDEGRRRYRLDKFVDVARAMMARRKIQPSDAYLERLGGLHAGAASFGADAGIKTGAVA